MKVERLISKSDTEDASVIGRKRKIDYDEFACPVCMQTPMKPPIMVCCKNGHSLCGDCFNVVKASAQDGTAVCPQCRMQFPQEEIQNISLMKIVASLMGNVTCPNGCGTTIAYADLVAHDKICLEAWYNKQITCPLCSSSTAPLSCYKTLDSFHKHLIESHGGRGLSGHEPSIGTHVVLNHGSIRDMLQQMVWSPLFHILPSAPFGDFEGASRSENVDGTDSSVLLKLEAPVCRTFGKFLQVTAYTLNQRPLRAFPCISYKCSDEEEVVLETRKVIPSPSGRVLVMKTVLPTFRLVDTQHAQFEVQWGPPECAPVVTGRLEK